MTDDFLLGFLKASSYRIPVLALLNQNFFTPREIADDLDTSPSQISRTLRELLKNELIICNTPNRNKGKIFRISENGIKLLKLCGDIKNE